MCNCIKETEDRYKEHLKENDTTFKDIEIDSVEFENKAYMFNIRKTMVMLPIKVEWTHTTKKGRQMKKRKQQSFTMQYCPFCGEKQE